ncbi:MAG: VOC family protein [Candidatus Dormiibacterota bacterium]|jgi:methylmalonyl-CoA/ethylmalonyl-CoA epimerase
MAIIRLQHIGVAVRDLDAACRKLDDLFGLKARDFRDNQGKGMQRDARILLGNQCWLHLVQNWDTESRVYKFLEEHGEGLEHIALESDDITADVERVKAAGVEVFQKRIFDATDGFEAFIYPEDTAGFTVELIQPHADSWGYPDDQDAGSAAG